MHEHHSPDVLSGYLGGIVVLLVFAGVGAYLAAVWRLRSRGDHWSWWRSAAALSCGVLLLITVLAPLPGAPFTRHMIQHLVVGMVAPLTLVLARPVTLALRALRQPVRAALLEVVRSRVVAVVMCPPVAALLDIGGLWLLYRTGMFAAVHDRPGPHALVFVHVFASGTLFSTAVTQLEPVRHRYSLVLRATTLVAAAAGHGVLAKTLYAAGPPGTSFAASDLQLGAQIMYYGGDVVELALAAVVAGQWYLATGRAQRHARRRAQPAWPVGPRALDLNRS
ncbi:cytochrome c oxidase assembly protein [Nocardia goodfellowii]|uniref:Membrane protein n=1 Tax=Nocardia goodfellowii TaxID=882446 RepID=A0ABS4QM57_9NOCA|nr:cytochrome c oxidase assembly protein [Nocardia goodfellowii]MBP2192787.1 putative membrane protein [Nocardia goodfellowii]